MEKLVFNNYAEMRRFFKYGGEFKEPERVGEVTNEVPAKRPNKGKAKRDAVPDGE